MKLNTLIVSLGLMGGAFAQTIFADDFERAEITGPAGQIFFNSRQSSMSGSCFSDNSFGVGFGDLNYDGWPDAYTLSHAHRRGGSNPGGYHCVWTNNSGSSFSHSQLGTDQLSEVDGITCTWSAQVTDVNGDSKPDIWCRGSEAGSDFYLNTTAQKGAEPTFEHTHGWLGDPGGYKDEYLFFDLDGDGTLERVNDDGDINRVDNGQSMGQLNLPKPDLFDIDGDSFADIWSYEARRMMRNNGDGTFTERNWDNDLNICTDPRGAFHQDYDKDGDLDLVCIQYRPNPESHIVILRNDGNFNFSRVPGVHHRIFATTLPIFKGTIVVDDFDNNSYFDVFSSEGQLELLQQTSTANFDFLRQNDLLDDSALLTSHKAAAADYNNDGLLDTIVALKDQSWTNSSAVVLENGTVTNNRHLSILLQGGDMGSGSNVNAQGAKIVAYVPGTSQIISSHYVEPSWKHTGPNFLYHLGVAGYSTVDLKIYWPSGHGQSQTFRNLATNAQYKITYRAGSNDTLAPWAAGSW